VTTLDLCTAKHSQDRHEYRQLVMKTDRHKMSQTCVGLAHCTTSLLQ